MEFDWKARMKEVAALREQIARGKRHYKLLNDLDDDLMAKAQTLAEVLGGTEQAVQELKNQQVALTEDIATLKMQYEDSKRRVAENVPGWDAELAEKQKAHTAAMASLEGRYQARNEELKAQQTLAMDAMAEDMNKLRDVHRENLETFARQTHEAQQQLALVRKAMSDLAASATGA